MNRREFLRRLEVVTAGSVCGAAVLSSSGCIGFHYVNASVVGNRLVVRADEFKNRRFVLVDPPNGSHPIFVYHQDDGEYSAVSTRCMHRGCPVEPTAGHLVCPCHGSEYTNTGEVLKGPTQHPLRRFPTTVDGQTIAIELPVGAEW